MKPEPQNLPSKARYKPNGSEWFPWEEAHPVEGFTVNDGFLKYLAPIVKDYSLFKNVPVRRFKRELSNFVDKAHSLEERKKKIFGYWIDYSLELQQGEDSILEPTVSEAIADYQAKKKDNELREAFDYTQIDFFGNGNNAR